MVNTSTDPKVIGISDDLRSSSQGGSNVGANYETSTVSEPGDVIMNLLNRNGENDNRGFNESVVFEANAEVGDDLHVRHCFEVVGVVGGERSTDDQDPSVVDDQLSDSNTTVPPVEEDHSVRPEGEDPVGLVYDDWGAP